MIIRSYRCKQEFLKITNLPNLLTLINKLNSLQTYRISPKKSTQNASEFVQSSSLYGLGESPVGSSQQFTIKSCSSFEYVLTGVTFAPTSEV
jgi:hypothetical protein